MKLNFSNSMMLLVLLAFIQAAQSQFNDEGRQLILDQHNNVRSKVATGSYFAKGLQKPPAANMSALVWDKDLEKSAQAWAETCPHNRSQPSIDKYIGENIYWWMSFSPNTGNAQLLGNSSAITWESEFQDIGWPSNNLTAEALDTGIGHAVQIVWARTRKIGCGLSRCPAPDTFPGQKWAVVCQYHPKANYLNREIYESGPPCTNCPGLTTCDRSKGLCVPN